MAGKRPYNEPIMRKTALLCLITLFAPLTGIAAGQITQSTPTASRGLFSQSDVKKAWKAAVSQQKPMLVMFTSEQCIYCQKMLNETYGHTAIKQMLAGRTETVLAHAEDYRDLTKKLGIRGYPTTLLIAPNGDVLDLMQGFVAPQAFAERVRPLLPGKNPRALAAVSAASHPTTDR